ncbi:MAG: hypothetical protein QOI12_2869 [Alphaproteobacteria bacterium]|nr:hypothetical protein [Alphaproteobacteria bacterium]
MFPLHALRRAMLAATSLLAVAFTASADRAEAQAKLEASYTISVARIPIGNVTASVEIGDGEYAVSMTGRASGVMRVLTSGEGTLTARGAVKDGRPVPESYVSTTTSDDDTLAVKMTFEDGSVKELTASAPPPSPDRVALTDAHRRNVVDPLTAVLVPAAEGGNGLSEAACQRTLPIFDGRRRYDLKLAFKRMDVAKADKGYKGYAGPIVVCAVAFQPLAGHRASSSLVNYLSEGREIEIAFAPLAGTRVLAPFRVSVANMLGNLVVQASRFEVVAPASLRASTTTGQVP